METLRLARATIPTIGINMQTLVTAPTQQFVDWLLGDFARDVPARKFNPGKRRTLDLPAI